MSALVSMLAFMTRALTGRRTIENTIGKNGDARPALSTTPTASSPAAVLPLLHRDMIFGTALF